MAEFNVVSFGEVLFDIFDAEAHLGGAPLNLAVHLSRQGAQVSLVSAVGRDELGSLAIKEIANQGLGTCNVAQMQYPTGRVLVKLDEQKIPEYFFDKDCAYDHIPEPECVPEEVELFCFGTLAQRCEDSRNTLKKLLAKKNKKVFLDANLRQNFYSTQILVESLAHADILKINEDELPVLCEMFSLSGQVESLSDLARKFELETVILTLGAKGCAVWHSGELFQRPAHPARVVSTVGAGDAFSAAFLYTLLNSANVVEAMDCGSAMAAKIAEQSGAF